MIWLNPFYPCHCGFQQKIHVWWVLGFHKCVCWGWLNGLVPSKPYPVIHVSCTENTPPPKPLLWLMVDRDMKMRSWPFQALHDENCVSSLTILDVHFRKRRRGCVWTSELDTYSGILPGDFLPKHTQSSRACLRPDWEEGPSWLPSSCGEYYSDSSQRQNT